MFKTVEELKSFIMWAKAQKIAKFKVSDIEIEVSQIAFIEDLYPSQTKSNPSVTQETETKPIQTEQDDEDFLFDSAN